MSHEESTIEPTAGAGVPEHAAAIHDTAVQAPETLAHEPIEEQDEWPEELEELPRRPRRRLLGAGGNLIFLALLGVLLSACGFIGGVLIEKGETSSSSSSAGSVASLASRFRALRGGGSGTSASGALGGSSGGGAGFARPTAGTVAYLAGSTLYVTNSEGSTVKVTTSPGTTVTKTVKATLGVIHPGETVTVTGAAGASGAVNAESISVGSTAGGGGLAALLGGSGSRSSSGGSSSGGGAPSLFGSG